MSNLNTAKLRDFAKAFESKRENEKLEFYQPFNESDIHFNDPEGHECDFNHTVNLTEISEGPNYFTADTQADFHRSRKRSRWPIAANRAGKTFPGAAEACLFALGEDGHQFWEGMPEQAINRYKNIETPNEGWAVSRTGDTQKEGSQKTLLKLLPRELIADTTKKSAEIFQTITLTNGSQIGFKTTDQDREAFQSAAKRWIWFDEEPKSEAIYNECKARKSPSFSLDIWGTMTPVNGMTFLKERIVDQPGKHDIFRWSLWDNPYYSNKEVQDLEQEFSRDDVLVRIYGLFAASSGLIYPMFERDIHVRETFEIPPTWTMMELIDPGFVNESGVAYWAISPTNYHFIVDEIYKKGLNIPELCGAIHNKRDNPTCAADGVWEPRVSIADPQVNETNSQTKRTDREVMASNKPEDGPRVLVQEGKKDSAGIRTIRNWLRPGRNKQQGKHGAKFFVLEHCKNFIYEMENYRKKPLSDRAEERRNPHEKPRKKDDHLMNCAKYGANENPCYIEDGSAVGSYEDRRSRNGRSKANRRKRGSKREYAVAKS